MAKTINREPYLFEARSLKENYLNFVEFNGLCDNKNYLDIDQSTFADVNNMYLDQDKQLSSRPPLKKIDVLLNQSVIKIYKVNTLVFYHTTDGEDFYINFKYKDEWYSRKVTEKINIAWFDERYVIFMEDDIISFELIYPASQESEETPVEPEIEMVTKTFNYTGEYFDLVKEQMQASPGDPIPIDSLPLTNASAIEKIGINLIGTPLEGVEIEELLSVKMRGYRYNIYLNSEDLTADEFYIENNTLYIKFYGTNSDEWYRFHNLETGSHGVIDPRKSKITVTYNTMVAQNRLYTVRTAEDKIQWYTAEETVYIPITESILGGVKNPFESENALTTSKRTRYVFDSILNVDTKTDLVGKDVVVTIEGIKYNITWRPNNDRVFVSNIGHMKADLIQVASNGSMLAINPLSDKENMYYSFDGSLFYRISTPIESDDTDAVANIVFADDGSSAYYLSIKDDKLRLSVMGFMVGGPSDLYNLAWSHHTLDLKDMGYDTNLWVNGIEDYGFGRFMSSTRWTFNLDTSRRLNYAGHSPEVGKFVAILPVNATSLNVNNVGDTFMVENSPRYWSSPHIEDMIKTPHEATNEETASLLLIYTPGDLLPDIKMYPIYLNLGDMYDLSRAYTEIRLIDADRPYIYLSKYEPFGYGDDYLIACDKSYNPYHRIPYKDIGDNINKVYKDALVPLGSFFRQAYHKGNINGTYIEDGVKLYHASGTSDKRDVIFTYELYFKELSERWPEDFEPEVHYVTGSDIYDRGERLEYPWYEIDKSRHTLFTGTFETQSGLYKLDKNGNLLTDRYLFYGGSAIPLIVAEKPEVGGVATTIPLYIKEGRIFYQDRSTDDIYDNFYRGRINVDLTVFGITKYIVPSHIAMFITNVVAIHNTAYISNKREGQVYLPVIDTLKFPDNITALANFTQTSLGIFLENEVFELLWNIETGDYYMSRTKLQMGCKNGSEVLSDYDGKTIFITTIKGLNALNYQDFVQSSEHVYNYLTERIMSAYDAYAISPIKLTQYKNWVYMYRTDSKQLYVFDIRNMSWWKWTNAANIQQIVYDGKDLLVIMNGEIYKYDFDINDYYDDVGVPIEWSCTSQRLHFKAPNNYKHIRSLSVIASHDRESILRCMLKMKCYHNLQNLTDTEVVEYKLDQLTTAIYRVNFMKLNAFQFTICSDAREKERRKFATPGIAIKYRVTERVR